MPILSKLAATALILTFMGLPAAALASCSLPGPEILKQTSTCHLKSRGFASVKAALPAPCCQLSSGQPVPASAPTGPVSVADGTIPASTVSSAEGPSLYAEVPLTEVLSRVSGPGLQAILCTFLI